METAKIKICGLRTQADVAIVNHLLPDYAGFICCDRFWRYVPREALRELSRLTDSRIRKVGVFVDSPPEEVSSYIKEGLIDIAQLHGHESEEDIRKLKDSGCQVIKAFRIGSEEDISRASASSADYVLLDSGQGTGQTFDWNLIRDIGRNFFLAGGLNPENLSQAIERVHPFAVDISSGVETDRHKDADKVRKCIEIARGGRK